MVKATFEQLLEARDARRGKAQDQYLSRLERLESLAELLVGELCREGKTIWYVNLHSHSGKTKESTNFYDLISYLIRNKYVR